ncbi:MAG: Gfo/Idh/MocA family oxidoreductase [Chloroflexota bacterium]
MSDLHIGVIGAGGRGGLAAHAHKPEEGSRIVACCDTDENELTRCQERYGSDIFTTADYHAILAQELDAIFISTPDFLHEEMALAALEAGFPIYLEKPMAITIAGCDQILETAVRTQGKLYLGHNMRHMAFVLKMKDLIDQGAIGEVKAGWCRHFVGHGGDFYFKDWHADRRLSTGMLLQKATHDIDVMHWLCSGYSELVNALGALTVYGEITSRADKPIPRPKHNLENWPPLSQTDLYPVVDIEDLSMMNMRLDNGVHLSYQQCHYTPDYWRNYTFIGTEGRLENFGNGEEGTVIKIWNKRRNGYDSEADITIPVEPEKGGHGGADPKIVQEFLDFVRGKVKPSTSPVAARYSVAAGCAGTESLRNGGQPISIEPLQPNVVNYFR